MKRKTLLIIAFLTAPIYSAFTQFADSADVFILTCSPGTASYSIYGHTALRVAIRGSSFDNVYNWGIFDFSTPNFVYRFAKGRLDYMLGAYSYERFLGEYISEGRSVWSQKLNLTTTEKERLFDLINENLKPENIRYRYDFFFDNCATRVRDIIAAAASDPVIFPVKEKKKSFRQLIDPYQKVMPWLDFGADMLLGLQADRKATAADEMFLPMHLKENMSEVQIMRHNNSEKLTGQPETIVDLPVVKSRGLAWMPQVVFYAVLACIILVTFVLANRLVVRITDVIVYLIYSVISLLLIFTNLFSEHDALHYNLLILGINPLIPVLFYYIVAGKKAVKLSRIALVVALLWLPASLIAGQGINPALIPMVLIIMVRLFSHCEFGKTV